MSRPRVKQAGMPLEVPLPNIRRFEVSRRPTHDESLRKAHPQYLRVLNHIDIVLQTLLTVSHSTARCPFIQLAIKETSCVQRCITEE